MGSMNLCKYKDIFGKERQGFHSIRVFDIAIGDLVLTIIGAYAISNAFGTNFVSTTIVVLVFGVLFHRLFCVNTKVNTMIFGIV